MISLRFTAAMIVMMNYVMRASAQEPDSFERLHEISKNTYPSEQEYNKAKKILDRIAKESHPGGSTGDD